MISHLEGSTGYTQNFNVENELESVVVTTSFTHDAAGIRVKTVEPSGKTTHTPFPGCEEEVNGSYHHPSHHLHHGRAGCVQVND